MQLTESQIRQIIREELVLEQQLLKEDFMGALSQLAGGGLETIKESIARYVLDALGVDIESMFSKVLVNFFGNLTMEDVGNLLMGDHQCVTATGELAGALTETMIENLPGALGVKPNGIFGQTAQEVVSKVATQQLNDAIANALCEIDYQKILSEVPGAQFLLNFV